jgi:hypothetical protein
VDPRTGEETLIEKIRTAVSWYGRIIDRVAEEWEYAFPGSAPVSYSKTVHGRAYLPEVNTGRNLILLETEKAEFLPFTSLQPGKGELSSLRILSGYAIYNTHQERQTINPATGEKLEARDQYPIGPARLIVDSARSWREAIDEASIVEQPGTPQIAKWVDPMIVTTEITIEEIDKFITYRTIHNRLRPGPAEEEGPIVKRKDDFRYRLPVEIHPPTIEATVSDATVRIEVRGGGAEMSYQFLPPERYRIFRRITDEPSRGSSPDPYDRWLDEPPRSPPRVIVLSPVITDLSGTPRSPLPPPISIGEEEPGDTSEPTDDGWTVIATVDNAGGGEEEGHATVTDEDLLNGASYEYTATAIIGADESAPAEPAAITFGGPTRESRIKVRTGRDDDGVIEVDVLAPEDPDGPGDVYGETVAFDIPAVGYEDGTAQEVAEEIANRQFVKTREPKMRARVVVNAPLTGIERGQKVTLPTVQWKTVGNELILEQETESDPWILDGFTKRFRASAEGLTEFEATELELIEP